MAKNILQSKSFWLNVIAVGAEASGYLPGGPLVKILVLGGLNIGTRILTKEEVTILPQSTEDMSLTEEARKNLQKYLKNTH